MRATTWALEANGTSSLAAATKTRFDLLADYRTELGVNHLARYTVTHIIGQVYFRANDVPSTDSAQELALGVIVGDENIPGGSDPSPRTDNANWMWQHTILWVPWTIESSAGVFRQLTQSIAFNIRTQRILRGTESVLRLVVHNVGGEALSVDVRSRTLLRVP